MIAFTEAAKPMSRIRSASSRTMKLRRSGGGEDQLLSFIQRYNEPNEKMVTYLELVTDHIQTQAFDPYVVTTFQASPRECSFSTTSLVRPSNSFLQLLNQQRIDVCDQSFSSRQRFVQPVLSQHTVSSERRAREEKRRRRKTDEDSRVLE